jgi:hypothetical protein
LNALILRTRGLEFAAYAGLVYLFIGLLFYFTDKKAKFREIQRKVFQPIFAPALFVTAGYFLGVPAPVMSSMQYLPAVAVAIGLLVMATIIASMYELMET